MHHPTYGQCPGETHPSLIIEGGHPLLTTWTRGTEIVVVGAGPYGLSLGAHLREQGVPFRIFGKAMQTWSTQMPEGMYLYSGLEESSFSTPGAGYTLGDHLAAHGKGKIAAAPVALEDFVTYGETFARRFVPELEADHIRSVDRQQDMFRITTAAGERLLSRRVVIATGLNYLHHVPDELRHLPPTRVTHPSQHNSYRDFCGRDVTVLGSGASALNAAVLLHEAGAKVVLVARATKLRMKSQAASSPHADPRHYSMQLRPDLHRHMPGPLRTLINARRERSSLDLALTGRLQGFPMLLGSRIHAVEPADGACERLRMTLTDKQGQVRQHLTSHLISATGYRYNKDRLQMLSQSLREQIRVGHQGAPKLNRGFESSVPGLHFVGPMAAPTFGPHLRSIAGSAYAAQRVTETLKRSLERESQSTDSRISIGVLASRQRTL